jgi:hypothetical protein
MNLHQGEETMTNGFYEFGLLALVAFFFVNLAVGLLSAGTPPPNFQEKEDPALNLWKEIEAGIPTEGGELTTPEMRKKTGVV